MEKIDYKTFSSKLLQKFIETLTQNNFCGIFDWKIAEVKKELEKRIGKIDWKKYGF